jgi:hypothetical protein
MVYHKHKVVQIGIPKTASRAIHDVLKNSTDIEHDHATILDTIEAHDNELIQSYYCFSVVRNPYTRTLSAWKMQSDDGIFKGSFREKIEEMWEIRKAPEFSKDFWRSEESVWKLFWIPQHKFISFRDKVLMDRILKYENLEEEWCDLARFLTLRNEISFITETLPRVSKYISNYKNDDWHEYYEDDLDLYEKVYQLYKRDFELFGYEK